MQLAHADANSCATPGRDGPVNASDVVNTYFPSASNSQLNAGGSSITVGSYYTEGGNTPISAGDMLMIIQMQDATINSSNTAAYGSGNTANNGRGQTSLGNSGAYEFVRATNSVPLTGGTLTFEGGGASDGVVNTYTNADPTAAQGRRTFQVIRVVQYASLTLSSNITVPDWNGTVGGVLALDIAGNMDFNGFTIDADNRGFRGGFVPNDSSNTSGPNNGNYVLPSNTTEGSGKGEGIAGTPRFTWDGANAIDLGSDQLPGGDAGRGAPGNAAGGGNAHNAGGGGGGNGGSGGTGGIGYKPVGGDLNGSRGLGGAVPVPAPVGDRLIMGGGGGGGDVNDDDNGIRGGQGGGIVYIQADQFIGSGTITSNGSDGEMGEVVNNPDGAGGGGAGGTVALIAQAGNLSGVTVEARGGNGGNTRGDDGANREHGPGAGGGGGVVISTSPGGQVPAPDLAGGDSGRTDGGAGSPHSAEDGEDGVTGAVNPFSVPPIQPGANCFPALNVTKTEANPGTPGARLAPDTADYSITVTNTGAGGATGVQLTDELPSDFTYSSGATATLSGGATGPSAPTNSGSASVPIFGDYTIPKDGSVTINFTVNIAASAAVGTYQNPAYATYLDPTRTSADPNRRITAATMPLTGANTTYESGSNAGNSAPGSNYDSASSTDEDVVIIASNQDYGDAPDTYGTDSVAGNSSNSADPIGATHTIVSGIHLGTAPDAESDAATPLDGTGDGAEDDGITLTHLTAGDTSYSIPAANIAATGSGTLHGWVDFDKDGVFEASEHASVGVTSGTPSGGLSWSGITAGAAGDTYARFRFTSDTSITLNTPGGAASDGEVEDYEVTIASPSALPVEMCTTFANDIRFVPLAEEDTANGLLGWSTSTGTSTRTYTNVNGSGIDIRATAYNEDGTALTNQARFLPFGSSQQKGGLAVLGDFWQLSLEFFETGTNTPAAVTGIRHVLEDFETKEGSVENVGNFAITPIGGTSINLDTANDVTILQTFSGTPSINNNFFEGYYSYGDGGQPGKWVIVEAASGQDYSRIDVDMRGNSQVTPIINLCRPAATDTGDAPDSYGDAEHTVTAAASVYLGNTTIPDAEFDTQNSTNGGADGVGDDNNGADDEDGVTLPASIAAGDTISLPVTVTGGGLLNAWIDWDNSGVFDPDERIATDAADGGTEDTDSTTDGAITLSVAVPTDATVGTTYSRFRYSSSAGLGPQGPANDGEVEDYEVAIAASPIASQPFICDNSLYIVIGSDNNTSPFSQLNRINRTTNPFTFEPIGPRITDYNYNALAYNPVDNYLYGIVESTTSSGPFPLGTIVRIGTDGVPTSLGIPQGDVPTYRPNAGTFLADGTYVIGRGNAPIHTIDVTTAPPTSTNQGVVPSTVFQDFAVNPYDSSANRIYGIEDTSDRLVYFDATNPSAGTTAATSSGTTFNHNYGSQFYDSFGNFLYRSGTTNGLYTLESDGSAMRLSTSGSGGSHDGASCFSVGFSKAIDSAAAAAPVPAGQTVTYTYQIANSSNLPMTVALSDDLRSVDDYTGSTPDESSTPVNGTYTGTINAPAGSNVTIANSDQSLTISDILLSPQSITTITAEVMLSATAPADTYYNQAVLTGMPSGFVSLVRSDDPTTILYGDPTAVETAPVANNPSIALVKRLTAINRGLAEREQLFDNSYVDVAGDPNDNETDWPGNSTAATVGSGTVESYISGLTGIDNLTAISGTTVRPGDQIEYTIPFLSNGDTTAEDVLICDRIPQNTTFVDDAFNSLTPASPGSGNRGIYLEFNNQQVALTNTNDGDEIPSTAGNDDGIGGYYFAPGVLPSNVFPDIDCGGSNSANDTGAIVVDLSDVSNATGEGVPDNSYGLVRFRVSVD